MTNELSEPEKLTSIVVATTPFDDQKPGTSGLRKKVKVFMQPNYTENFVQSILNACGERLRGSTLVVGGDGRYYGKQAVYKIIKMCAANGVKRVLVGRIGLLSTPAVSCLIRSHKTLGGILLTASHNPGGIRHDFGIKFNIENGGPAPDSFSDAVYQHTLTIQEYKITKDLDVNLAEISTQTFIVDDKEFIVDVIDPVQDYLLLMKSIFDFDKLHDLIRGQRSFNIRIDSMNGVAGVYAKRIFTDELKAVDGSVVREIPLDNFGELHPDPNLTYAVDLVNALKNDSEIDFGAAFDGDADRNMILGKNAFFVTPSDSLAVIANNLKCIPYFQKNGIRGFARSMPTGSAVDLVAKKLGKEMFVVPVGWKYFGNLMDAGRLSLCGEESFGTGSDHIREKDGIWAALAWLSIIEHKKMSVENILHEHWQLYGRNYYTRYDYEECDSDGCNQLMRELETLVTQPKFIGKRFISETKCYVVKIADNFSYQDQIDNSRAVNQGIRIVFEDGSRIIFRLSGTGSTGSTLRIYIDSYEKSNYLMDAQVMLKPLVDIALEVSQLKHYTGREQPTVIT